MITVSNPSSEIEAEAKRKLITEKEIKLSLSSNVNRIKLESTKVKLRELLNFYDRIIHSINNTIKTINGKKQLISKQKNDIYLQNQEKELSQAKREKLKFRRYLQKINEKLDSL